MYEYIMAFTMHKAAVEGFRTGGGSQELANLPWLGHGLAGAWPGKGPGLAGSWPGRGLGLAGAWPGCVDLAGAWPGWAGPGWGLAWLRPGLAGACQHEDSNLGQVAKNRKPKFRPP